jgi:hypothetical protein
MSCEIKKSDGEIYEARLRSFIYVKKRVSWLRHILGVSLGHRDKLKEKIKSMQAQLDDKDAEIASFKKYIAEARLISLKSKQTNTVGGTKNKIPSIVHFLKTLSSIDENFEWEASEDIIKKMVTIGTNRILTDNEKLTIERYGHYYSGPSKYIFNVFCNETTKG